MASEPAQYPARFKDVCMDAVDGQVISRFWSAVLDRPGEAERAHLERLSGPTPGHTIWINEVAEPKEVKNRVHLDIYATALDDLQKLGARILEPQDDGRGWTVMADPGGGEFCAFLRAELPAERLHGLVVDSVDPRSAAAWWAGVLGGDVVHGEEFSTIGNVPGMPIETFDFVPVPEPKAAKNRIHWDVTGSTPDLVEAGATVLRSRDDDIRWDVLVDPEGNEFCVFPS